MSKSKDKEKAKIDFLEDFKVLQLKENDIVVLKSKGKRIIGDSIQEFERDNPHETIFLHYCLNMA